MPASKAQIKSVNKYIRNNYDRISLTVEKGEKLKIAACAKEAGESMNEYIRNAIGMRIKKEKGN